MLFLCSRNEITALTFKTLCSKAGYLSLSRSFCGNTHGSLTRWRAVNRAQAPRFPRRELLHPPPPIRVRLSVSGNSWFIAAKDVEVRLVVAPAAIGETWNLSKHSMMCRTAFIPNYLLQGSAVARSRHAARGPVRVSAALHGLSVMQEELLYYSM